jgi:hypothetical protein
VLTLTSIASVTALLSLLCAAALWLLYEIVGLVVGDLLRMVFGPVLRPIGHLAGRMLNAWTVRLLWLGALASLVLWPYTLHAPGEAVHLLGSIAFMALTPLALMATFAWRDRGYGSARETPGLRERWNR